MECYMPVLIEIQCLALILSVELAVGISALMYKNKQEEYVNASSVEQGESSFSAQLNECTVTVCFLVLFLFGISASEKQHLNWMFWSEEERSTSLSVSKLIAFQLTVSVCQSYGAQACWN